MKHRKEVPLREVLEIIDDRIFHNKSHRAFLRAKRVPSGHRDFDAWSAKTRHLRVEKLTLGWLRRDLSNLRYGPDRHADFKALLRKPDVTK